MRRWIGMLLAGVVVMWSAIATAQERNAVTQDGEDWVERMERTLAVEPGGSLVVDAEMGLIHIETWNRGEVHVRVEKRASTYTDAEALRVLEDMAVTVKQKGTTVTVTVDVGRSRRRRTSWLEVNVTVPDRFNVDLTTEDAGITVEDLEGDVTAKTSSGSVKVGVIENGSVELSTSAGSIRIAGIRNGSGEATTSGGSITVGDVSADLTLETAGGSIKVGRVGGVLEAETAGGSIRVKEGGADTEVSTAGGSIRVGDCAGDVRAETAGGSISIGIAVGEVDVETSGGSVGVAGAGGRIKAETAGGNIKVEGARGAVEAETAGGSVSVELVGTDANTDRSCSLETSGGDVKLTLPAQLAATVDAEIRLRGNDHRRYEIESDFPLEIQGTFRDDEITARGAINGGGDLLRLRTTNGDIEIRSE